MTRQTIKECNDIIRSQADRITELEDKLTKGQQFNYQQLGELNKLRAALEEREAEVADLEQRLDASFSACEDTNDCCRDLNVERLNMEAELESAYTIESELREYIEVLLDKLQTADDKVDSLNGDEKALRDYNQSLADRLKSTEQTVTSLDDAVAALNKLCTERYDEIKVLTSLNVTLRQHLDSGVLLAEDTIKLLEKYAPCISVYEAIKGLIENETTLHNVLDDATFLDALYPCGGQNIRTLVRFILHLVP